MAHKCCIIWHTCAKMCDRFQGGIGSDFIGIFNIFHFQILEFVKYQLFRYIQEKFGTRVPKLPFIKVVALYVKSLLMKRKKVTIRSSLFLSRMVISENSFCIFFFSQEIEKYSIVWIYRQMTILNRCAKVNCILLFNQLC